MKQTQPSSSRRLILIGNYQPDGQKSMELFADLLTRGFRKMNHQVEVWRPVPCFGRLAGTTLHGLGKWLGYLDKWILFPCILRMRRLRCAGAFYHICDHSNAPYLGSLPKNRTSITCHDVLAIRGALGHADAYCKASKAGVFLQRWILARLAKASKLATVSHLTLDQLKQLAQPPADSRWRVIPNSFNQPFQPMLREDAAHLLAAHGLDLRTPFILHVGSSLPRKNRGLLLRMAKALEGKWNGLICFAGAPIDPALSKEAESLGIADRTVGIPRPSHEELIALYSTCEAFVFPSFSEGFGWPLIEAQACGAPVIASNIEPMPEVSGGSALHADPSKPEDFAAALLGIVDPQKRSQWIEAGYRNCRRYQPEAMIAAYQKLIFEET